MTTAGGDGSLVSRLNARFLGWVGAFWVLAIGGARVAAEDQPRWYAFAHEHVLGTSLELTLAAKSALAAEAGETAALAEIDRLAAILSSYDATSEFSRWQATREVDVAVSIELFEVLALFDTWRERTGGALDAAAEVAGRLWKTAGTRQVLPTADEIAQAVAVARQRHWRLDAQRRTARHLSGAPLVLNSFTKSYIIERAVGRALAAGELETVVMNLGGDIVVRGAHAVRLAVADPEAEAENDLPLTHVGVSDRAVATSGGYRRGVDIRGHWYSHLVDPRTGWPVDHVRSATVVAARATDAGALATALAVLPAEEGLLLAASVPGAECLIVVSDGRRLTTAGWRGFETAAAPPRSDWIHAAVASADRGAVGVEPAAEGRWDPAMEAIIALEIASVGGGRSRKPFVAIWIEDRERFPVRTLALWYHGARWLPDLRAWNHADQLRAMAEGTQVVDAVASATRGPGKYTVKWDGKDTTGKLVAAGHYTVAIEVAREHGTHQILRQEIVFAGEPQHFDWPANPELAGASLDYGRKRATR
ncbi:MAG: hypothetical protein RL077_1058 [Verrucomicrobiota bacterium]